MAGVGDARRARRRAVEDTLMLRVRVCLQGADTIRCSPQLSRIIAALGQQLGSFLGKRGKVGCVVGSNCPRAGGETKCDRQNREGDTHHKCPELLTPIAAGVGP